MKRTSALAGLLGIVLLAFGIIGYALTSGGVARLFIFVNLVGGAFAIIGWLTSSWGSLGKLAGGRSTRYGANAALYSLAFLGLLIAVNYLAARFHRTFDMTAEKAFSLSPQSLQVVRKLKQPLKLYGFVQEGHNVVAETLFQEYAYASPKITYELVDPNRHPEIANRFKVATMNTTHLQYGGDHGSGTNVTEVTEQAITNGILKLTSAGAKEVCFLSGEGEANPNDAENPNGFAEFKKALEGENYTVTTLNLVTEAQVPSDCSVLAIAGPTRPLVPHVVDAANSYLERGGRLLAMFRPPRPDQSIDETAFQDLMSRWGVRADDNVVVDQVVRLFAGPALGLDPMVTAYAPHPITATFDKQTVFPMTRSLTLTAPPEPGLIVTALARTSDTSWAEVNLVALFDKQTASFHAGDTKGPVTVAAAVEANLMALKRGKGIARLVVFGDTDFASNQFLENFFNRDFIMNSIDWLAGEANSISIRPRTLRASRFNLTIGEFDVVFVLSVLLIPELLLIIGISVWWERRV